MRLPSPALFDGNHHKPAGALDPDERQIHLVQDNTPEQTIRISEALLHLKMVVALQQDELHRLASPLH
jgi:hypothetical protein